MAAEPKSILDYIESKKGEYLKLLPELEEKQKKTSEEGVEYYKSYKGVKTLMSKMIKEARVGDVYRTFSIDNPESYEIARERVFSQIKPIMKDKKIITKGIFSEKTRYKPTKDSRMQKKYLSFSLPPNTSILGKNIAIVSWEEEPSGILIHSKEIAKQYADFFDALWKVSKK